MPPHKLLDRQAVIGGPVQQPHGLFIEAVDVLQHAPEAGVENIAALGKELVKRRAVIFQPALFAAHAETHVGIHRRHPKLVEQAAQIRIIPLIKDDKTGVNRDLAAPFPDSRGIGMAAAIIVFLKQGDLMPAGQIIGRGHARNAGPDDGDTHRQARPASPRGAVSASASTLAGTGCMDLTMPTLCIRLSSI